MIEMIAGVFGLPIKKDGHKTRIIGKGPNDGPFSAAPEQEERLVNLGLARYVSEHPAEDEGEAVADISPIGFDETPPEDFDDAEVAEEIVDFETLTAKELREIGKEYGLSFKANAKKVDMIAAIEAAQAEIDDGEPAPDFDPAEAVV